MRDSDVSIEPKQRRLRARLRGLVVVGMVSVLGCASSATLAVQPNMSGIPASGSEHLTRRTAYDSYLESVSQRYKVTPERAKELVKAQDEFTKTAGAFRRAHPDKFVQSVVQFEHPEQNTLYVKPGTSLTNINVRTVEIDAPNIIERESLKNELQAIVSEIPEARAYHLDQITGKVRVSLYSDTTTTSQLEPHLQKLENFAQKHQTAQMAATPEPINTDLERAKRSPKQLLSNSGRVVISLFSIAQLDQEWVPS